MTLATLVYSPYALLLHDDAADYEAVGQGAFGVALQPFRRQGFDRNPKFKENISIAGSSNEGAVHITNGF